MKRTLSLLLAVLMLLSTFSTAIYAVGNAETEIAVDGELNTQEDDDDYSDEVDDHSDRTETPRLPAHNTPSREPAERGGELEDGRTAPYVPSEEAETAESGIENFAYTEQVGTYGELYNAIKDANDDYHNYYGSTIAIELTDDIVVEGSLPIIYSDITLIGNHKLSRITIEYINDEDIYADPLLEVNGGKLTLSGVTLDGGDNDEIRDYFGIESDGHFWFEYGNAIDVYNGGELYITGGEIRDFASYYPAVEIYNGYLRMTGGKITGNTGGWYGGGLSFEDSTAEITGGEISDNECFESGGGIYACDSDVEIKNCIIKDNRVSTKESGWYTSGGGIYIDYTDEYEYIFDINITDSEITGNVADHGGGIYIYNNDYDSDVICANLSLDGTVISGNTAYGWGGGIYADSVNMCTDNCKIDSNAAEYGGGFELYKSNAVLNDTSVDDNIANAIGGGIISEKSALVINGGSVSDNEVLYDEYGWGGGIYATGYSESYNYDYTEPENCIGDIIGDYIDKKASVESGFVSDNINGSISDALDYANSITDSIVDFFSKENHEDYYLFEVDTYMLSIINGCEVNDNIAPWGGGGICVDGYSYDGEGISLYIDDSSVCGNELYDDDGGGIYAEEADVILNGAVVDDNLSYDNGGGVYVYECAVCLNDSSISNNYCDDNGGGVYSEYSYIVISGTAIDNNYADYKGGGIYLEDESECYIADGSVSGNESDDEGAGIYVDDEYYYYDDNGYEEGYYSKLVFSGGSIKNNINNHDEGGGVFVDYGCTMEMSGGIISGNYADDEGGGIYARDCNLDISGGTITGNSSEDRGGGIYIYDDPEPYDEYFDYDMNFTMRGKPVITGNSSGYSAKDNICLCDTDLVVNGRMYITAKVGVSFDTEYCEEECKIINYKKYKPLLAFFNTKPFTSDNGSFKLARSGSDLIFK